MRPGRAHEVRNTAEAALDDALQSITDKLVDYFSHNFSVYGTLVSYDGSKAILSCGSPQGVVEGDEFQVLQVTMMDGGKVQKEHIGKLKVKELIAGHHPHNLASQKVLLKLGFKCIGASFYQKRSAAKTPSFKAESIARRNSVFNQVFSACQYIVE